MQTLSDIGQSIQRARKQAGLTQSELATRAGLARSTIAALETGRLRELGINKLLALLRTLGLEIKIAEDNRGRPTLDDLLS